MSGAPKTTDDTFECGSCLWEVAGYSKKELLAEGWTWHAVNGRADFPVCSECNHEIAKRRALRDGA